ncbi:MAG: hypothetical protein ACRC2J_11295 [Microcoleaceae cyanobacterium]
MSDQENSQVKIFFDSNRFPWERQYTDGKGNWYFSNELNLNDLSDPIAESTEIFLDTNKSPWEPQYKDGRGNWYFRNRTVMIQRRTFVRCINSANEQCLCGYTGGQRTPRPTTNQCRAILSGRP